MAAAKERAGAGSGLLLLLRMLSRHPRRVALAACCALVVGVLGWGTAYFVQAVVDHAGDLPRLGALAAGLALLLLARAGVSAVRQAVQIGLAQDIDGGLARRYLDRILRLDYREYESHKAGDLVRRLNAIELVRSVVQDRLLGALFDAVLLVAAAAVLCSYSVTLTVLALAGSLAPAAVMALFRRRVDRHFEATQEIEGRLNHSCVDALRGIRDLRTLGAAGEMLARHGGEYDLLQAARRRHEMWQGTVQIATNLLASFVTLLVLWLGARLVGAGTLTAGRLMFVFAMSGLLTGPVEQLANFWWVFGEADVALERLGSVFRLPAEPEGAGGDLDVRGDLALEGVSFGYRAGEEVLRDVWLRIAAGTSIAIVGESGAGKSTLLALLAGLLRPDRGRVCVDGRDLRRLPIEGWRRRIGAVFQSPHLFEATIEENLRMGCAEATAEDVRQAARIAHAEEFILARPQGYATPVTRDGANFSGGQAQRLALARALARDPRVLLLDEATSNLDVATESAVWRALTEGSGVRTTVFVAHRLSSTVRADRIVVLHEGRIVEEGSFHELMSLGGRYHALWKRQMPAGFPGFPQPPLPRA